MIKNIIFDVNKVLRILNNEPITNYFSEELLSEFGSAYTSVLTRDYFNQFFHNETFKKYDLGLISQNELIEKLSVEFNEPKQVLATVLEKRCHESHNTIFSEMIAFIKQLRADGFKVFILSNMGKEAADALRVFLGEENFDDIVFSCDVHMAKPNLDIYEYALRRFSALPKESLFIDDTFENLLPFNRLGGRTFLFDHKHIKKCISDLEQIIYKN